MWNNELALAAVAVVLGISSTVQAGQQPAADQNPERSYLAREGSEPPRGRDNERPNDRQGGRAIESIDPMLLVREGSEPPRGRDNERPNDRQGGRAIESIDPMLLVREGSEPPRGRDNERAGDRQRGRDNTAPHGDDRMRSGSGHRAG